MEITNPNAEKHEVLLTTLNTNSIGMQKFLIPSLSLPAGMIEEGSTPLKSQGVKKSSHQNLLKFVLN